MWIFSLQAQAEKMIYDNEKQQIPTMDKLWLENGCHFPHNFCFKKWQLSDSKSSYYLL